MDKNERIIARVYLEMQKVYEVENEITMPGKIFDKFSKLEKEIEEYFESKGKQIVLESNGIAIRNRAK